MKNHNYLTSILRFAAFSSPLWAPILAGYCFSLYGKLFDNPSRNLVEGSVALVGLLAFLAGAFSVLIDPMASDTARYFNFILYSCVALFILFFTGWSGMQIGGYGH
ncbi:hypothetical protein ACH50O_08580 [Methylomonas sp. 2BW1-5-20]|uniref:hypothetical protein n=1 Tax=Methylomonas sp. 2BW1-5-20 TaxID=3376686 RepID=UPI00404CF62D